MDSRRNIPPAYDEHARMMRRDPLPSIHHHTEPFPPELLERKLASQTVEIEQLTMDNRKLAASYMALRQDLANAKGEADKIREHMRSIQNEGDIQISILLDKIAKTDADTGVGDSIKKELQAAHAEAQSLMTAKLELSVKLKQATKELDITRETINKNTEMRSELDSLKQEYQRLRKTFEYEKCSSVEKVEEMKILEKDLIGIAEEVERLRAEVLSAEMRASGAVSYSSSYMKLDNTYPLPHHGNGGYTGSFGIAHPHIVNGAAVEMMNPYASGGFPVGPQVISGLVGSAAGVNGAWGGVYTSSLAVDAQPISAPVSNAVCEEVCDTSSAQT
ncbi:protein FLX-like 4 [Salvia miltiorrhiza]|uniref:protein FLX-like 4 n=1 Tax=Salvia miltiorrhiza TaxID=226208 RepID=UPI0025AC986A|nr:protein FLX-like 4 [Salvia miltiorrhiza]